MTPSRSQVNVDDRRHVLLVDDEPGNVETLAAALAGSYDLSFATTAREALELAQRGRGPDLILLDILMSDMDGFEVCSRLKSMPTTAHIPVIFVSALGDPANEQRGLEAGAVDYIYKPITPAVVRARISVHIEMVRHKAFFESLLDRRTQDLRLAEGEVRELLQTVRDSELRFRAYAEASSDWFWETDSAGQVSYVSDPAAEALMVAGSGELRLARGAQADLEDQQRDPTKWRDLWAALEGRQPVRNFELAVYPQGGPTRHVRVSAMPTFAADGAFAGYRGVGSDISDSVASQRQAAALRDAMNAASDALILYDHRQRVVFTNHEYHLCFAHSPSQQETIGRSMRELLQLDVSSGMFTDAQARRDPAAFMRAGIEEFEDDAPRSRELTFSNGRTFLRRQRRSADGDTLVLYTDVSERRSSEQRLRLQHGALRRMTSALALAEERERRRIAAELHDGPVQTLGLARMKLGVLRPAVKDTPFAAGVEGIREPLDEAIARVRQLMMEVSPPILYELGLAAALEWLVEQTANAHGLRLEFHQQGDAKPLGNDLRVLLFQATRELLANVAQHARASSARVTLSWTPDQVAICVSDDGVGFDVESLTGAVAKHEGYGLLNLQERLRLLSGDLVLGTDDDGLYPADTAGAEVSLVLPLET